MSRRSLGGDPGSSAAAAGRTGAAGDGEMSRRRAQDAAALVSSALPDTQPRDHPREGPSWCVSLELVGKAGNDGAVLV